MSGMSHAGPGMGRGIGFSRGMGFSRGFRGANFGRFGRGRHFAFRHRFFRHRRFAFVGGGFFDDCYARVWTRWGWRWVYVCW
jgi:hypothetical protein